MHPCCDSVEFSFHMSPMLHPKESRFGKTHIENCDGRNMVSKVTVGPKAYGSKTLGPPHVSFDGLQGTVNCYLKQKTDAAAHIHTRKASSPDPVSRPTA